MKKLLKLVVSIILAVSLLAGFSASSYADGAFTFVPITEGDFYAKAGTKFYSVPSTSGAVVFTEPTDMMLPINGVCLENGWYRTNYNGAPAYINPSQVYSRQDAYNAKTVGLKAAAKKVSMVLSDGSKLYTIGTMPNGMPIYSVFANITAPDYFVAALLTTGIQPTDDVYTKIYKVRKYVSSHVVYDLSCRYKYGSTYDTLTMGRAVCYGYAQATQAMLLAVGVDAISLSGRASTGEPHQWCAVNIDGVRYSFVPQDNPDASPIVQGNDAGKGHVYSGGGRFSNLEKISATQKPLAELTRTKWKK